MGLDAAEREVQRARGEARALRVEGELLANDVARLNDIVAEQADELEARCARLLACQSDRARARYALVRASGVDLFYRDRPAVHHGVWTPGRPFLFGEHVYGPVDGCCYAAPTQGLAPGHPPGVSRYWMRCAADAGCPVPVPVPVPLLDHPVECGDALRQAQGPPYLTPPYLADVPKMIRTYVRISQGNRNRFSDQRRR